ncbi:hypothetical protein K435DRAFT_887520 [Dendrothele bispora CBS 962.96]|uniref:Uncharacterized protein n=1 Tax=Dendrothele bispora (strain CBS 962.96) TaxID=1314807 RepID=A0A4S8KS22_DENBC|nr:hypothetical protein K435DRAFT_887520 [Dendrothele bispora CBS 962.96]
MPYADTYIKPHAAMEKSEAASTSSTMLSQLDKTQLEAVLTVRQGYTLTILMTALFFAAIFRLRYPCMTLSGLKEFVDKLNGIIHKFTEEGGPSTYFRIRISSLRRNIDDIEYQRNNNIFLWSSTHRYLQSSFVILWKIIKCYDKARDLQVSILNAITHKHRALEDFEDNYHRNLSVQGSF